MSLKSVLLIALVSVAFCYDLPSSNVLPPHSASSGYASTYQKPNGVNHVGSASNLGSSRVPHPSAGGHSGDENAQILRQSQNIEPDGSYQYNYETDNGIQADEQGYPKDLGNGEIAEQVSGSFSYTAPDGQLISLSYIADENGFQPSGEHLPTSPPVPDAIQRALQYIEAHGGGTEY